MWIMEQSSFKNDIGDGKHTPKQLDLNAWSNNKIYTANDSVLQHTPTKQSNSVKANSISKRNFNRKIRTEKQIVDMVARELTRNPHLIKCLPSNPQFSSIQSALNQIQASIFNSTGRQVNLIKAYTVSERTSGLLHQLLAMAAKGVIVPFSKRYNTKGFSASKGSSSQRIYLLSTSQATSGQFRKTGKMSGLFNSKPAITHFRIEAINELKSYLPNPKSRFQSANKDALIISDDEENLFDELQFNYGTETWGHNDTNSNSTMATNKTNHEDDYNISEEQAYLKSLSNMSDEVLAQNAHDGFVSKQDLRAALKDQPRRLVKVSKELQRLSVLVL